MTAQAESFMRDQIAMNIIAKPQSPARATIKTVALHAGVSVPAVSKVLRNAYGVSDALRQKVEASIRELDYRPNVAARAMRGQTFTIGVLLVEISNPFLQQIVNGLQEVLNASNYKTLFGIGQSESALEASLIENMISHQMDGLILVAPQIHGETLAGYARQIPMVVIGHHEATATTFDTVNSNDREGAEIAVRALIERGHTDIAMLNMTREDPDEYNVDSQRLIGYHNAMNKAGLGHHARVLHVPWNMSDRPVAIKALLQRLDRPRALFCWSDLDAVRIVEAAQELSIDIPDELAVVGYDNSSIAGMAFVNLASIDQSGNRIGALAAETLLSRIGGRKSASHELMEPRLEVRSSLGS
jgi:LacI family transcriptional regulator